MSYSQKYDTDQIVGIILIVASLCGVCAGSAVLGLGALIGLASAGGGFLPGAAAGGVAAVIGGLILLSSVLNIVAGVGIMKSARWGLLLGAVVTGLSVLLAFVDLSGISFLMLVVNGGILVYCLMRLSGRLGPTPN